MSHPKVEWIRQPNGTFLKSARDIPVCGCPKCGGSEGMLNQIETLIRNHYTDIRMSWYAHKCNACNDLACAQTKNGYCSTECQEAHEVVKACVAVDP